MSTATPTKTARSALPRSLPTITVFTHPAARLVKTVPQLQPPTRVNGHVPRDTLGVGRTSSSDVVLTDVYGPLSILVVPDPLDPTIATLVLSVGFQDALLQGAARRFVLPFRSFQRDPVSGQLISQSRIKGFDAADRKLYPGLGAGLKGLDGGSFWFFEDVGEEGAFDRYRWERDGVGRRAIWTVWLISTPAPIVLHVQSLLQSYPAPISPLPPWLKEENGFPWQDSYLSLKPSTAVPPIAGEKKPLAAIADNAADASGSSSASVPHRPLPSPPQIPIEAGQPSFKSTEPTAQACSTVNKAGSVDTLTSARLEEPFSSPKGTAAFVQCAAERSSEDKGSSEVHLTESKLSIRSRHLRDGSSSVTIGDSPEVILRNAPRAASGIPQYRNSLVAVDNLTGQIIGVLASDVGLDLPPTDADQAADVRISSSDEADADVDEDDEAQTPLDEHVRVLHHKEESHALGLQTHSDLLQVEPIAPDDEENILATPRSSAFVHRPAQVYRDADADRIPSRPPSVLAIDTFAPPPLPPKQPALRGAHLVDNTTAAAPPSRRTSTASAAFFSAESDTEAMSSYDSDALEIDASTITHDKLPASFISIRGKAANDIERHRPELLQDQHTDDDTASDASGSTVGGPAVRMWRKARGKTKKKGSVKPAVDPSPVSLKRQSLNTRQASEVSDRTSKAETAFEALSDTEMAAETEQQQSYDYQSGVVESIASRAAKDPPAPLVQPRSGPGHHLPRTALRTEEVRSIEDRVWREALDGGDLPIDAPYTHLAARGGAEMYPSSILSSPQSFADGSAIELRSAEDKAREVQQRKKKQQQQNLRAERIKNMQGGTVLIEFLAGSSRIGASLIRSAGLDADSAEVGNAQSATPVDTSSKTIDLASSVFGYVPLLPQHVLSFLGLASSTTPPSAVKAEAVASGTTRNNTVQSAPSSYLPSIRLPLLGGLLSDASDWVSNLFTFNSTVNTASIDAREVQPSFDASKAEEWEYAIPDFDPNSLASTPRPIYRRKRPVPSAMNGFTISAPSSSDVTRSDGASAVSRADAVLPKPRSSADKTTANDQQQRYSILHIDSLGFGRRAFLRGMPGVDGVHF